MCVPGTSTGGGLISGVGFVLPNRVDVTPASNVDGEDFAITGVPCFVGGVSIIRSPRSKAGLSSEFDCALSKILFSDDLGSLITSIGIGDCSNIAELGELLALNKLPRIEFSFGEEAANNIEEVIDVNDVFLL